MIVQSKIFRSRKFWGKKVLGEKSFFQFWDSVSYPEWQNYTRFAIKKLSGDLITNLQYTIIFLQKIGFNQLF